MSTVPQIGRLERRKERTRQSLLDAGRKLIGEVGVTGLRIQEVTEAADIGLGTFYSYFTGKDDLIQAIVTHSLETLADALAQGESDQDPAVVTAEATRRAIRLAFEEPEFAQLLVNLDHSDEVFSAAMHPQARAVVVRGIEAGRFDVPDVEIAVNYIVSGALSLIRQVLAGRHQEGVEVAQAELALRTLGLSVAESRKIAKSSGGPRKVRRISKSPPPR